MIVVQQLFLVPIPRRQHDRIVQEFIDRLDQIVARRRRVRRIAKALQFDRIYVFFLLYRWREEGGGKVDISKR